MKRFIINVYNCFFSYKAEKIAPGKMDKDVGKLLYNIATKLKVQIKGHQNMLVEYIVSKKITSEIQLNGKEGGRIGEDGVILVESRLSIMIEVDEFNHLKSMFKTYL